MILDLEGTLTVGEDCAFKSMSPVSSFGVVFEDDTNTGYLYAIDNNPNLEMMILDAVHIYNVADVTDKQKPCSIKIAWTDDGQFASLLINNYCHAIFDFKNQLGYCRNAFPPPNGEWSDAGERIPLTDQLINELLS
ncbi:DUF2251 domain-containing protein [Mucilaginibacter celer]|uniref:DUF2251 domain-containing protein n=1 Tax=Mucilaginibacter celer TaxID=2305508 RepID=A0A494W2A6_9SPHI|nr:DUF2251 domain-containing protein [Mucilaginibacter celer]AYL97402.1 DUF2251 domain-containing protein [Mucilaginibacter celer]